MANEGRLRRLSITVLSVLTLTIRDRRVLQADFAPAHLDDTGVPVPAAGAEADRINDQWERVRACAGLAAGPPR